MKCVIHKFFNDILNEFSIYLIIIHYKMINNILFQNLSFNKILHN